MPRGMNMNMHVTADDAVELRQLMDVADQEFELPPANENNKTDPEYESDLAVPRVTFGRTSAEACDV